MPKIKLFDYDIKQIIFLYTIQYISVHEIAQQYNVWDKTISNILKKQGVFLGLKTSLRTSKYKYGKLLKDWNSGLPMDYLMKKYDYANRRTLVKVVGRKRLQGMPFERYVKRSTIDPETLEDYAKKRIGENDLKILTMYRKGIKCIEISRTVGCHKSTVSKVLKKYGLSGYKKVNANGYKQRVGVSKS